MPPEAGKLEQDAPRDTTPAVRNAGPEASDDHDTSRDTSMKSSGQISAILPSLAFWVWSALLSYPMMAQKVNLAEPGDAPLIPVFSVAIWQATGLLLFLVAVVITRYHRLSSTFQHLNPAQVAILAVILMSLVLQLHGDEPATLLGIGYTVLILVTALALAVLWTMTPADVERCTRIASIVFCLFGIVAITFLGWPQGRNVGSIQPNLFATPLLAGFILSQFSPGRLGVVVRILCIGMVALVSSRFALLGCICAFMVYELTYNPLSPWKIPVLIVAFAAGLFFWPQLASVFALDDASRDLSSGFSGRDVYWQHTLSAIADRPLGIGFKRGLSDASGHNGYLKTLLEFGIAGGALIIVLVGCNIVLAGIEAVRSSRKTHQQRRFASARFAGLLSLSIGAFFQPQLLSLGDAFAMSFMFLLFRPRTSPTSVRRVGGRTTLQPLRPA